MDATISLRTGDFAVLLRDVVRAASDDTALPMIAGVLLHTADSDRGIRLAATATDRFSAIHGHVPATGALPAPIWLTRPQVRQVVSVVKPYTSRRRAATSQTEIAVSDGKVTVRQVGLDDLADVAVSFPHMVGDHFPNVHDLITKAMQADPSAAPYTLAPQRLVMLAQIAAGRGENLRLRGTGGIKPVLAQIGNDLVGIIMPVRASSDGEMPLDVPVYPLPVLDQAEAVAA